MKAQLRDLAAWLHPELCLLDVDARDGKDVLDLAAHAISQANSLDHDVVLAALLRREQAASTGMGGGFAIPHARVSGIVEPMTAFVRTKNALAFRAPDGKGVSEFFFIMVPPEGDREDHLRLLALVSSLLADAPFRRELRQATVAAEVGRAFLAGVTRAVVRGDVR